VSTVREARCVCGQLRLETDGEPDFVSLCHCLECQRRSGSPFGVGAYFPVARVHIAGTHKTFTRQAAAGRSITNHFCPECGSNVFWEASARAGLYGIAVGAFADQKFPPPNRSVYEATKHPWVVLDLDIEHFAQGTGR
jgi:hypothetical protein